MDFSDSQDPLQENSQISEVQFSEDEVFSDSNLSIISTPKTPKTPKTHPILGIKSTPSSSIFNTEEFTLSKKDNSKIYIFSNKLFTRKLLPINIEKDREIIISCTRCIISYFINYIIFN